MPPAVKHLPAAGTDRLLLGQVFGMRHRPQEPAAALQNASDLGQTRFALLAAQVLQNLAGDDEFQRFVA